MADEARPFHNPFGALAGLRDTLPQAPAETGPMKPDAPVPAAASAKPGRTYARAVVRMERSGRGGKEATVIEQLALSPFERDAWVKDLKAALGCGGKIEGDTIMLQGDQRDRLKRILTERGVKKVTIG
jgi:translation initiation factor 1